MFLPVFVHPGKRGPSPVKKSPEKSTAKGGPPAPPSATSSTPPNVALTSHPLVPRSPAVAPYLPPASRMHVSPCTLSLRVKKYLRPPARTHQPARQAAFFPHTCVKASRPHTHTYGVYTRIHAYAQVRARGAHIPPPRARRRRARAV